MGTFNLTIQIANLNGEDVEVMVDTGAITTVIPRSILAGLGIHPTKRETFEYAGGEQVQLDMAEARARVDGRETITWVIFGEEGGIASAGCLHFGRRIPRCGSLQSTTDPSHRVTEVKG